MSAGFLLPSEDSALIWRGPKKNGLIKQLHRDVDWDNLDYLLVDTPPGTSDEHLSIVQYLSGAGWFSWVDNDFKKKNNYPNAQSWEM